MSFHSQVSLLRAATPSTPIHSTHNSASSSRSFTPGPLSLHEYRKQQSTPSPQVLSRQSTRSLRRKPAASGLNVIERIPSSPPSPPEDDFTTSTPTIFHLGPTISPSPTFSPGAAQTQPTRVPSPSLFQQPPNPNRPVQPPVVRAFSSQAQLQSLNTGKIGSFKPIKRLPRPGTPQTAKPLVRARQPTTQNSPLLSDNSSTSNLLDIPFGATDTGNSSSSISLSRFPRPPIYHPTYSADLRPDREGTTNHQPTWTALDPTNQSKSEATSPTVVHYRGASFDVVNPHNSLYLSNIETPAEREQDATDYFDASRRSYSLDDSMAQQQKRKVFTDFQSAHSSITGRASQQYVPAPSDFADLPLPPTPVAFPHYTLPHDPDVPISPHSPPPLSIRKTPSRTPTRKPTFREKFTNAFSRNKSTASSREPSTPRFIEERHELLAIHARTPSGPLRSNPVMPVYSSANTLFSNERDIETAREPATTSASGAHIASYYDNESVYPSSIINRDDSRSIVGSRNSVPFGMQSGELDYAGEVQDMSSYMYEFVHSRDNSRMRTSRDVLTENFLQHPQAAFLQRQKDSTIGSIIDRYHSGDISEASLLDIGDAGNDGTLRLSQMSGVDSHSPGDGRQQFTTLHSGLSQFDFGLDTSSRGLASRGSDGSSLEDIGPKTPEQPIFGLSANPVFRSSPGAPPAVPAPAPPSFPESAPRSTRFGLGRDFSGMTSPVESSYGDTRALLHIPPLYARPNNDSRRRSISMPEPVGNSIDEEFDLGDLQRPSPLNPSPSAPSKLVSSTQNLPKATSRPMSGVTDISLNGSLYNMDCRLAFTGQLYQHHQPQLSDIPQESTLEFPDAGSQEASKSVEVPRSQQTALENVPDDGMGITQTITAKSFASDQSSIPKMWGRSSPVLRSRSNTKHASQISDKKRVSQMSESIADVDDEEEEVGGDWETVGDMTRPDFGTQHGRDDSIANVSSVGSFRSPQGLLIHPGNGMYEHDYKLHTLASGQDALLPDYKYGGSAGFPNRNVLTPPRSASTHPSASGSDDPFKTPYSSTFSVVNRVRTDTISTVGGHYGQAYGTAAGSAAGKGIQGPHGTQGFSITSTTFDVAPHMEEGPLPLSPEPNDEILYEPQNDWNFPWSTHTARSPFSPGTTISSPKDRDNSFMKVTVLGPKGNITGTPEGTGMRDAGSSLADNSSSARRGPWSSSQPTPKSPLGVNSPFTAYAPGYAPLAQTSPGHGAKISESSYYTIDSKGEPVRPQAAAHRTKQRSNDATMFRGLHLSGRGGKSPAKSPGGTRRASVQGQKELKELRLKTHPLNKQSVEGSDITRFSDFYHAGRPGTASTVVQPLTRPVPTRLSQLMDEYRVQADRRFSPHLIQHPRYNSDQWPAEKLRKQKHMSWIAFCICSIIPIFLLLICANALNPIFAWYTNGEIDHVNKTVKRWANRVLLSFIVVGGTVTFVVVGLYKGNVWTH